MTKLLTLLDKARSQYHLARLIMDNVIDDKELSYAIELLIKALRKYRDHPKFWMLVNAVYTIISTSIAEG